MNNICLINDSFPPLIDGVANTVKNYADIINRGLGTASVVTPYYPGADDSVHPYPVVRYPSLDTSKYLGYRAGYPFDASVLRKLQDSHFDVIHTHCPIASTYLARTMRESIQAPVILTYHTKFDIDIAHALKSRLLQTEAIRYLVKNIEACDEVWAVSRGAGENLKKLGYSGDYIVMPNGVDMPRGRVSEDRIRAVGAGLDLPEELPLFLYVGRMMWYKGLRITLDALKRLKEEGIGFRMVFVGGGGDLAEVRAYAEELGLTDRVFFTGPILDRERIRDWYCRADLFLFPSSYDTNGLVVREAAACSLGSVLIQGSCAAEDSTDGVNSLLIEENAASMAECLKKVCGDPGRMRQLGEAAERDLYLSWEDAVKNAWNRYEIVLDTYRSGGYPVHESLDTTLIQTAAQILDGQIRARRFQEKLQLKVKDLHQRAGEELNPRRLYTELMRRLNSAPEPELRNELLQLVELEDPNSKEFQAMLENILRQLPFV